MATTAPPDDVAAAVTACMRLATAAHKRSDLPTAESHYRAALALGPHPGAAILLANLLQSRASADPGLSLSARAALRAEALPLARQSVAGVEARSPTERKLLWARYAYFLLSLGGYVVSEGGVATRAVLLPAEAERKALLAEATAALRRVVALDAGYVLAWRNLALALGAAEAFEEAEGALRCAVAANSSSGGVAGKEGHWELLYRHGKALKRCGREEEALGRIVEAVAASGGREELPLFWLRVALAEEAEAVAAEGAAAGGAASGAAAAASPRHSRLSPQLLQRVRSTLAQFSGAPGGGSEGGNSGNSSKGGSGGGGGSVGGSAAASAAPPNAYIRKLFDGYAAQFDAHLVGALGYRTPAALASLAAGIGGAGCTWRRTADLGCGTGLAGGAFALLLAAPRVLEGCDLSPGMLAEAAKLGMYTALDAAEAAGWVEGRVGAGGWFDLVLCADVVVYMGDLMPLFSAVARALRAAPPLPPPAPPPLFVFSTEALLGPVAAAGEGYRLSGTGRCQHAEAYVRQQAAGVGMRVAGHAREVIRENGGLPVQGDLWALTVAPQIQPEEE